MGEDEWLGLSSTAWTGIYTVLTAGLLIVAVVAALVAWNQWKASRDSIAEARKAEIEARRPYVVVTAEPGRTSMSFFDLVIRNVGQRPAIAVKIRLDPPPVRAREEAQYPISKMKLLNDPISLIAPGQEIRAFYDSSLERKGRTELPVAHKADVSYSDTSQNSWHDTFVLDLEALQGVMYQNVDGIHHVSQSLRDIKKVLSSAELLSKRPELDVHAVTEGWVDNSLRTRRERLAREEEIVKLIGSIPAYADQVKQHLQRAEELKVEISALEKSPTGRKRLARSVVNRASALLGKPRWPFGGRS